MNANATMATDPSIPPLTQPDSVAEVFDSVELTECILLYIDIEDVMRSRRINKFIQAVVAGSGKLQRKIFAQQSILKPEDGDGSAVNVPNHVIFPRVGYKNTSRGHEFHLQGDATVLYHTAFMKPTPARKTGRLFISRFKYNGILNRSVPILPTAHLDSFVSTHPCDMPVYVSVVRKKNKMVYAPPGTTLRELVAAVNDYDNQSGRGNNKTTTALDVWKPASLWS